MLFVSTRNQERFRHSEWIIDTSGQIGDWGKMSCEESITITHAQQAQQSMQAVMRARVLAETWLDVRSKQLTEAMQSGRNSKWELDMRLDSFSRCYQNGKCKVLHKASMSKRHEIVMQQRLFFDCLQRGHWVSQCSSSCPHCGSKHHGKLCRNKKTAKPTGISA